MNKNTYLNAEPPSNKRTSLKNVYCLLTLVAFLFFTSTYPSQSQTEAIQRYMYINVDFSSSASFCQLLFAVSTCLMDSLLGLPSICGKQ